MHAAYFKHAGVEALVLNFAPMMGRKMQSYGIMFAWTAWKTEIKSVLEKI